MIRGVLVVLSVILFVCPTIGATVPNYQACTDAVSKGLPYCDTKLTHDERLAYFTKTLTLEEKISLLTSEPNINSCPVKAAGIERIHLPEYMWLVETNTGVASQCMSPTQCATTFIGPMGLGASFNRSSWYAKGDVISTEMRAFNNHGGVRAIAKGPWPIGIDGFGPNINIARDPRFGRTSELPSEDPFLTGSYATQYVRGIQQVDSKGYIKMLAYLKHFDAYSVETNRGRDNHVISMYDFWDTYLPAYEMAMTEGKASGVMCSYNGENGHPSCANDYLLNQVLRKKWNSPNALVMTDCGAVGNLLGPPAHAPSQMAATAWAINNGTDIEAGSTYFRSSLENAIEAGLTTEKAVDTSITRAMRQLMSAGRFDPVDSVSWTNISADVIGSEAHKQVNYEAALQSFILLKNEKNIIPFKGATPNIAVVGPQGVARYGLLSDYYGDRVCYTPLNSPASFACIQTIGEAITKANTFGKTVVEKGVDVNSNDTSGILPAITAASASDVVVMVLGIDKTIEHEGIDRKSITLPGLQEDFAQKILALGKPTILVLVNGGVLGIDNLIDGPDVIIEAFNPALEGARALADTLFGHQNRWGKLPVTMYPADYINQVNLFDFDMSKPPGRTYRYYTNEPLFPFGWGLSMTKFNLTVDQLERFKFSCTIYNIGDLDGDEVVMVFHSAGSSIRKQAKHPVPLKALVQFDRVSVKKGSSATIQFNFDAQVLALVNEKGDKTLYDGQHFLTFTRGHGPEVVVPITFP